MMIQMAVLCDAATDTASKLSLLGAFDTIHASQLPALYPACTVAVRMVFYNAEDGMHTLRLSFMDADGRPVIPSMEFPLPVAVPADTHFVTRNLIINFQHLKFDKPGMYSIDLAVDGRQEAAIPLQVRLMPPGTPGGPAAG